MKRQTLPYLVCLLLPCCIFKDDYQRAMSKLEGAKSELDRFYALGDAAKESINAGNVDQAVAYAKELAELAPKYRQDWNYGNAVHDSHVVFGRAALRRGNREEAKKELLLAAKTPGSPQLDSFGPNLSLASDLLAIGERDVVIQYLELTVSFWADEADTDTVHRHNLEKIRRWQCEIREGGIPDFGGNMVY